MPRGKYVPPHKRGNTTKSNTKRVQDNAFRELSCLSEQLACMDKSKLTRLPIDVPTLPLLELPEKPKVKSYATVAKEGLKMERRITPITESVKVPEPHKKKLVQYDRSDVSIEINDKDMAAINALSNYHRRSNYEQWKHHYAQFMEDWFYEHKEQMEEYQISYDNFCRLIYRGTNNTLNKRTHLLEKLLV